MRPTFLKSLCGVLLAAGVASAAPPEAPRAVFLELAPLDEEVASSVRQQLSQGLGNRLNESFRLVAPAEVEALRAGAEKEPDVAEAAALIEQARKHLGNVQFKQAYKLVAQARTLLDPLRPNLRDYSLLTNAMLYQAVIAMNLGDKRGSAQAFADLARLRPDFRIDSAEFPPAVVEAFDKARSADAKQPRGRLIISSVPAGAEVYVDEVKRGQTPITVPASPGEHVIRLSSPTYLSWTQTVNVASYGKHDVKAELAKNVPQASLKELEAAAVSGGAPEVFTRAASVVAEALGADGVVLGIVALSVKGYVVTTAWLPRRGAAQVMAVDVNRSLDNLEASADALAAAVAAAPKAEVPAREGAIAVKEVGGALSRKPDFDKHGLGYAPGGAAGVLAEMARAAAVAGPGPGGGAVTTKPGVPPWVWVIIGVVAVGAAAGGTAIYFATREPPGVQFVLQRQ